MIKKEDNLWNGILKDTFKDFIEFMHPGIAEILNMSNEFQFLDEELEQLFPIENEGNAINFINKLVKVFKHDGHEEWILLHVEIRKKYQKDLGKKMFTYFHKILDKFDKRISTYILFTEVSGKDIPDYYITGFLGTKLTYHFNSYKIAEVSDQELIENKNPFVIVILVARMFLKVKHIKDSRECNMLLQELKYNLATELYSRNIDPIKTNAIMNFLRYYIRFDNKDISIEFEKRIKILTNNKMGIEEQLLEIAEKKGFEKGEQSGREATNKQFVFNLIHNFGYSMEETAEFVQLPLTAVKEYASQYEGTEIKKYNTSKVSKYKI